MSSSHGLCRLKLAPTKECNELSLLKSALLRVVVVWDAINNCITRHLEGVLVWPYMKFMNESLCDVNEVT